MQFGNEKKVPHFSKPYFAANRRNQKPCKTLSTGSKGADLRIRREEIRGQWSKMAVDSAVRSVLAGFFLRWAGGSDAGETPESLTRVGSGLPVHLVNYSIPFSHVEDGRAVNTHARPTPLLPRRPPLSLSTRPPCILISDDD